MLATLYVANSFAITADTAPAGLSTGDTVTWDVGKGDQVTGLIYGTNAFSDIQSALNTAAAGDTVQVAAGLYQLSTEIDVGRPVTLLGPEANVDPRPSAGSSRVAGGAGEAIIDGTGTAPDAFFVEANNVTINGFDLRNTAQEVVDTDSSAVYNNVQILDNFIHHATDAALGKGVHFEGVTNGVVQNNDIYDVADSGVEIGSGSAGASTNDFVNNNEVHDLGAGGVSNSALYAFATPYATNINVTFQGNLVYNFFGNDAIKVGSKDGADHALTGGSVLNNVVHDVTEDGITINASNTTVSGNEVYNSSSSNAAIYVEHSDGTVTIANNNLHDNTAALATILVGDGTTAPTGVVVSQNRLQDNTHDTLLFRDLASGHTIDASGNWWGSSTTGTVAGNVQSTTAGAIDFTPWLNSGTDTSAATPGFQPDLSSLTVAPAIVSPEFGTVGRIQEGINMAATGGTVTVLDGTYNEDVNLNKNVTVAVSGTVNGKISGSTGTIQATGALTLGDGSATAVNTSSNLNVGGKTVTLNDSAAASLGGTTTVAAGGTLIAANGLTILSGGNLTGNGTVNATTSVASGGSLSPGASVGTFNAGNVTLASGSTFNVTINGTDPNTSYSQLNVTGTVSLNGATLAGTTGPSITSGQTFVIINNDGADPISGTFNGLAEGATASLGNGRFTISYHGGDGNDVALTALNQVPSITSFLPTALVEGSGETTVTINGGGFTAGSTVTINGQSASTTFVTATQLTVTVPAAAVAEEGSLAVMVTTPGPGGGNTSATLNVTDAPLNLSAASVSIPPGGVANNLLVATFTDSGGAEPLANYSATIDWGDGATTAGSISLSNGVFQVTGSHAYLQPGAVNLKVSVHDEGGSTANVTIPVTVQQTPNQRYVEAVYEDVLARAVDLPSLASWSQQLDNGLPRGAFVNFIDHSAEYFGNIIITPAYQKYLGRAPDANGLAFWVDKMVNHGLTDEHLEAGFIGSPEFYAHAGGTDKAWIDAMYEDLLGRPADQHGEMFWLQQLAGGESRADVAYGFADSLERERQRVTDDYMHYLGRVPDQQGIDFWVTQFANGLTNEDVITGFVASDEYYSKHTA